MRYGEICVLSWEDIDIKNWIIISSRNMVVINYFIFFKIGFDNREIRLIYFVIEVLKN